MKPLNKAMIALCMVFTVCTAVKAEGLEDHSVDDATVMITTCSVANAAVAAAYRRYGDVETADSYSDETLRWRQFLIMWLDNDEELADTYIRRTIDIVAGKNMENVKETADDKCAWVRSEVLRLTGSNEQAWFALNQPQGNRSGDKMELARLLGAELKSPEIVETLELHDVEVAYDFDGLSEGQADVYWAPLRTEGLLFKFGQEQRLQTIFVYVQSAEGYAPCDLTKYGVESFMSIDDAASFAAKEGLEATSRDLGPDGPHWIRIDFGDYSVHYEFGGAGLTRITLMIAEVVPG
jgi:hypothetical protein